MAIINFSNGREVGDFLKPYVVAELNTSHFGDIEIAKDMITSAKLAGCDCVKFQSWSADTLYSDSYYKDNPISRRIVSKFALSEGQLKDLSDYASGQQIDFASTPYSIDEAEFLIQDCSVPFIKIASMELNNLPYLAGLASLGAPLVLSTGMGTFEEITQAVDAILTVRNVPLVILHCTSIYPAEPSFVRLENILGLREKFASHPIGYSDHTVGAEIPSASVALGACLIEKHFTLDSKRIGMDNQMATEPDVMKNMVDACHRVHSALGGPERVLHPEEVEQARKMRRSMVSRMDLKAGMRLKPEHIEFKRPGDGITPAEFSFYLGKVIKNDLEKGSLITKGNLS